MYTTRTGDTHRGHLHRPDEDAVRAARTGGPRRDCLAARLLATWSTELVDAVLEGAATFSGEVWGPLNKVGDLQGLKRHDDGRVTTPKGFVEAYAKVRRVGLERPALRPPFGGQGCPSWSTPR